MSDQTYQVTHTNGATTHLNGGTEYADWGTASDPRAEIPL
jgi:hypothetical protein